MKLGAQLYTVREFCKTTESLSETLSRIADMGYKTVQVSGTCEYDPKWLDAELKKNGLICPITHTPQKRILEEPLAVIQDHDAFGCKHIGLGCLPRFASGISEIDTYIAAFAEVGKVLREHGKYLMYHNHSFEFAHDENGKTYLDRMAERIPAEYMGFTLDTYWVQVGGASPAEYITRLSRRVPCIHLKDFVIVGQEQHMAAVGKGNLNFDAILSAAESAGTEYLLVEQDECYGADPFEELKFSYNYLRSLGIEP